MTTGEKELAQAFLGGCDSALGVEGDGFDPHGAPLEHRVAAEQRQHEDAREQPTEEHVLRFQGRLRRQGVHGDVQEDGEAREEEQTQAAAAGENTQGETLAILALLEDRIEQATQGDDGHAAGAGEGREERQGRDRHHAEAAGEPAQVRLGQIHHPVRRLGAGQHVAGEDEQRDGDEQVLVQEVAHGHEHVGHVDGHGGHAVGRRRGQEDDHEQGRAQQGQGHQSQVDEAAHEAPFALAGSTSTGSASFAFFFFFFFFFSGP